MKNLFLTIALMCCVSFAFANEGEDSKKDAEKLQKSTSDYYMATSCGTLIYMADDECDDEMIVQNMGYYECQHCGDCPEG